VPSAGNDADRRIEASRPRARRDRHGRGLRGPLAPSTVPLGASRTERFDDLVADAFAEVATPWGAELAGVQVLVEDIPPAPEEGPAAGAATLPATAGIPLGRTEPATRRRSARIVVYRRPVEARARAAQDREDLVREVVVGLVAELLGLDPDDVDPDGSGPPA
jgi:predicted Zn-dependent protease with MMP-like domain